MKAFDAIVAQASMQQPPGLPDMFSLASAIAVGDLGAATALGAAALAAPEASQPGLVLASLLYGPHSTNNRRARCS